MFGTANVEVACGRGGFVRALARKGADAVGLDFSRASEDWPRAIPKFRGGKQSRFRTRRCAFAAVSRRLFRSDCFVRNHRTSSSAGKGVSEFHRVAKPGGILFLTTPNYFNLMGYTNFIQNFVILSAGQTSLTTGSNSSFRPGAF